MLIAEGWPRPSLNLHQRPEHLNKITLRHLSLSVTLLLL